MGGRVVEGLASGAKLLQSEALFDTLAAQFFPLHACCDLAVTCVHGNHVGSPTLQGGGGGGGGEQGQVNLCLSPLFAGAVSS